MKTRPNRRVLLGGNPTVGVDAWEVLEYPVGVRPDLHFNAANLIFNLKTIDGTSADGCAEYTLPGPLQGRMLICFYEGTHTIHTFASNSSGTVATDNRPLLDEKKESPEVYAPSRRRGPSKRPNLMWPISGIGALSARAV